LDASLSAGVIGLSAITKNGRTNNNKAILKLFMNFFPKKIFVLVRLCLIDKVVKFDANLS
jgi:hypothetical protein